MTRYVKLKENNTLEFAPTNYTTENGVTIINFTSSPDIMLEYGFKKLVEAEKDPEHIYIITYKETAKQIKEEIEIDTEAETRRDEEKQKEEIERIKQLHMTRGDFFEGFIQATGFSIDMLRGYIEALPLSELEMKLYLNRFDNALDFYRGYPAVDMVGTLLKITSEQLTQFFETRDYHALIPNITTEQTTGLE